MPTFTSFALHPPIQFDSLSDQDRVRISTWSDTPLDLPERGTHFGLVQEGAAKLECSSGSFDICKGMYWSASGALRLTGGRGLIISQLDYRGFFHLGGPIESTGRLRYIDGCTDSLLIPPVQLGDPCLNLLHIPPHTRQTTHTHPSRRIGLIVAGSGRCVTPSGEQPLHPGLAFIIAANSLHSFYTDDEALLVIAFHPDSDFGPTHEHHPMINRTIIPDREAP